MDTPIWLGAILEKEAFQNTAVGMIARAFEAPKVVEVNACILGDDINFVHVRIAAENGLVPASHACSLWLCGNGR